MSQNRFILDRKKRAPVANEHKTKENDDSGQRGRQCKRGEARRVVCMPIMAWWGVQKCQCRVTWDSGLPGLLAGLRELVVTSRTTRCFNQTIRSWSKGCKAESQQNPPTNKNNQSTLFDNSRVAAFGTIRCWDCEKQEIAEACNGKLSVFADKCQNSSTFRIE